MESLDEISKNNTSKPNFFKHVFNFGDESKEEMLNILQYALLALIPIIILNKSLQRFVPEADEDKGSLELTAEIIIQVIVMFMGILIIHRIITFIPTYSGAKYADFSVTTIILAVLMITLSLQTKLGEKVSILIDRIGELWDGKSKQPATKKTNSTASGVKVSQPISQGGLPSQGTTSVSQLPTQQLPDYNAMYQQDSTPLVGASSPDGGMFEPMAANSLLGGSGFGSW